MIFTKINSLSRILTVLPINLTFNYPDDLVLLNFNFSFYIKQRRIQHFTHTCNNIVFYLSNPFSELVTPISVNFSTNNHILPNVFLLYKLFQIFS